ncbi:hypothetical protein LX36DRAFT_664548, partial [Colletotrichum falcatum]
MSPYFALAACLSGLDQKKINRGQKKKRERRRRRKNQGERERERRKDVTMPQLFP